MLSKMLQKNTLFTLFIGTALSVFAGFSPAVGQTYINDDSTVADLDEDEAGAADQAARKERYNDLIANLEISTQALEAAQQEGLSGEVMHDRRKTVKKYLHQIKKQIEEISELSDQSELVENDLAQMRQAKTEAEAALADRESLDD